VKRRMMRKVPKPISTASRGVSFKRQFWSSSWAFSSASTAGFYRRLANSFSNMPNWAEYSNLFDEFKITGIKWTFHPRFGEGILQTQLNAGPVTNQMYFDLVTDTKSDPTIVPAGTYSSSTYNTFLEKNANVKVHKFDRPVSLFYRPKIAVETVTGLLEMRDPGWLTIQNNSGYVHYGGWAFFHDYAFGALNAGANGCDIQVTYYFKCRGQN